MRRYACLFRTLVVTLLLFAQHGALTHALKHSTEPDKATEHAQLCLQCLDFAQANAAPLAIDLPQITVRDVERTLPIISSPPSALSDSPSFNFQSRAPPLSFT